jgi:uncharacterized protein YhaN
MWLKSIRVSRFGVFRDKIWPDLQPGFNLFSGPNEAGKTTLMMFLRGMLFGFSKTSYDPLDNSEPGGSLLLLDGRGGEWTVERFGRGKKAKVTVTGPHGPTPGEAGLRVLFQEVSRPVFENIFAFSLKELQDLESLRQREVRHLLYSASLGLGQVSLKSVEDRLHKQVKDLFLAGKRASTPEINKVVGELEGLRRQIKELEQQPQQYLEFQAEQARLEEEIRTMKAEEVAAKDEVLWLDKLHQGAQAWKEFQLARESLAALPRIGSFPEDGLARWEKIQAESVQVEEQRERWLQELESARAEAAGPGPDPQLLKAAALIESLGEERLRFGDREDELKQLTGKWSGVNSRLQERLKHLGPSWDEGRLENFHPTMNWRLQIQDYQSRLEAAAAEVRRAEDQVRLRRQTLEEKDAALNRVGQETARLGAVRTFPWGFAALGLVLAVAAAASYLWKSRDLTRLLVAGASMAFAASLVNFWQMRVNHRRRLHEMELDKMGALTALGAGEDLFRQEGEKLSRLLEEWRAWLQGAGLDADLTPGGALAFLQELAAARDLLHDFRELTGARRELETYLDDFTARLGVVLAGLGRPAVSRGQVGPTLQELRQQLAAAQKLAEHERQLARKISAAAQELEAWQARQKQLQGALDHLLTTAGEQEEEGFRRRAAAFAQQQEFTGKTRDLAARLRLLAGDEDAFLKLQADLRGAAPEELEERRRQAALRLQDLKKRREESIKEQGKLQSQIEGLERTDAWGRAMLAEQALAARLRDLARDWTVATLSNHFLEQARRRFEAECQPQVLLRASQYFELLTGGRYPRVMAPLEGESFLVVDRLGGHVAPERLSRGTAEQLYLALRFALIREYSREGRSLPLILDDILVNFDQRRARQAVLLLQEMSRNHQLLLFTCHPHILDLVQRTLGPEAPQPVPLEEI